MKKAYLKELATQLLGTVTDNPDVLDYFATDQSILEITPTAVVYPQNTADVRKTVAFVAARTAAGKPLSLSPRGLGADLGGAALDEGLQLVLPAHMNKILRLDHNTVTVQPGIRYRTLQQTLHTHGRFLGPYPISLNQATIGGAVANNDAGQAAIKYGTTREAVKGLKVVLSDGSLIQTHRLTKRELSRKKGLMTLEGEIYRKLDGLLLDHAELIKKHAPSPFATTGYDLNHLRGKDGSFDLSPILVGSQGTLGVITEITLKTTAYNPRTTLVVGYCQNLEQATAAVARLKLLGPSALEMVDRHLLEFVQTHHAGVLEGLIPDGPLPTAVLLIEFDDASQLGQKIQSTRAGRILRRHQATARIATDPVEQVALWNLRRSAAAIVTAAHGSARALPFIDDAVVPLNHLYQFMDKTSKLLAKHDLEAALWGSIGQGNLHLHPLLDLSRKKDIDRLFALSHEFNHLVLSLGGALSGSHNDGLLRAPHIKQASGEDIAELFATVKHIFDPHNIFNPTKKTQATETYARNHLRKTYTLKQYDYINYG